MAAGVVTGSLEMARCSVCPRNGVQTAGLAMRTLTLAVQAAGKGRSSSTSRAEVVATSANITVRLHALLGAAVVSGVWRDFLPTHLVGVPVLGQVDHPIRKVQNGGAVLTWWYRWQRALQMTQVCAL